MFTVLIYGLSVLWSIGCILGAIGVAVTIFEDSRVAALIYVCVGTPIALFIAGLPWFFLNEAASPNLAILKKNEWRCSGTQVETTLMPIISGDGKTTTLIPTVHTVCIQYSRL